jgi:hypothetical protein
MLQASPVLRGGVQPLTLIRVVSALLRRIDLIAAHQDDTFDE